MKAGVGKNNITPKIGANLIGYAKREGASNGVHDELYARALILDDGQTIVALCSVELCYMRASDVAEIRATVASRCTLLPEDIFVATTHTHSGPSSVDGDNWDRPFAEIVADAIVEAYQNRQEAKIGIGAGLLIGYNINRRWLDRPADPAVAVIRVDTAEGKPLAIVSNYACHAVVMGHDNLLISGDWPGYSSRLLERRLGEGAVALFMQGGAGDVNPLTENVRQRLAAGHPVGTIGELTSYYGDWQADDTKGWNIEDRAGGTFVECETLAQAFNEEVLHVWNKIETSPDMTLWIDRIMVNARVDDDEPPATGLPEAYKRLLPGVVEGELLLEIMLLGIGNSVIVGHPGESFSETAVAFRKHCQQLGYQQAMLTTYANGSYGYLPPENAFVEGGYEVDWPLRIGISRRFQARIQKAIQPILQKHIPHR